MPKINKIFKFTPIKKSESQNQGVAEEAAVEENASQAKRK